jgi:hypothetical protein
VSGRAKSQPSVSQDGPKVLSIRTQLFDHGVYPVMANKISA